MILLNDIMDLNLLSLGAVVPAAPSVLCSSISNLQKVWHMTWFLLDSVWNHRRRQTHTGHTGTNTLIFTYKYILTPPVMRTQQPPVLHWGPQCLCIWKFAHLKESYTCWWDSTRLSPSCETKNAVRNGVNEQNAHTIYRER